MPVISRTLVIVPFRIFLLGTPAASLVASRRNQR